MKRNRTMSKIVSMLALVGMTITLTVGCANKTASTSVQNKAVYAQSANNSGQSSSQGDNTANSTANNTSNGTAKTDGASSITTLFSNTLKSLASDGTITQTQADKVLEFLEKDVPNQGTVPSNGNAVQPGGQTNGAQQGGSQANGVQPGANQPNGAQPGSGQFNGGQPNANQSGSSGQSNSTQSGGNQTRGGQLGGPNQSNRLSELVTSNVITQAQADTINQKIQEALKNSMPTQNRQNVQPGQNGQNNQDTQNSPGSQNL